MEYTSGLGLSTSHISPRPPKVVIEPGTGEVLPFFEVIEKTVAIVHDPHGVGEDPLIEYRDIPVPIERQSLSSHSEPFARVYVDGSLVTVKPELDKILGGPAAGGGERGKAQFSKASRHRLMEMLTGTNRERLPLFVTLTYPAHFPDDPAKWKRDIDVLGKRFRRAFPDAAFVWRMEIVPRKTGDRRGELAPHFHLLVWGVDYTSLAPVVATISGRRRVIRPGWLSAAWWGVVDQRYNFCSLSSVLLLLSPALLLVAMCPDIAHLRAGTSVERIRSWGGVMSYASKYLAKINGAVPGDVGRWWGVVARKNIPWSAVLLIPLSTLQATKAIRLGRKMIGLSGKSLRYGLTWFVRGDRFLDYLEFLGV